MLVITRSSKKKRKGALSLSAVLIHFQIPLYAVGNLLLLWLFYVGISLPVIHIGCEVCVSRLLLSSLLLMCQHSVIPVRISPSNAYEGSAVGGVTHFSASVPSLDTCIQPLTSPLQTALCFPSWLQSVLSALAENLEASLLHWKKQGGEQRIDTARSCVLWSMSEAAGQPARLRSYTHSAAAK